jgi:Tfp pilus assembly protein PilN
MALRDINLIPEDILNRSHLGRRLGFWALCLGVTLALILGLHVYQARFAMARTAPPGAIEKTTARLISRIEEIRRVQAEIDKLAQRRSALEAVTGAPRYSPLILKLTRIMDGQIWLTLLTVDRGTRNGGMILRLAGFSSRSEVLGDFLNRLSGEALFGNVSLRFARETLGGSSGGGGDEPERLIQFEVECDLSRSGIS